MEGSEVMVLGITWIAEGVPPPTLGANIGNQLRCGECSRVNKLEGL